MKLKVLLMIFAVLALVWLISYNTTADTEYWDFSIKNYSL